MSVSGSQSELVIFLQSVEMSRPDLRASKAGLAGRIIDRFWPQALLMSLLLQGGF